MAARSIIFRLAALSSSLRLLLLVLLPLAAVARELRCDTICNYEDLKEQCERCRLRHPMRFGKRSSPPETETENENVNEVLLVEQTTDNTKSIPLPAITRNSVEYLAEALLWPQRLKNRRRSGDNLDALLDDIEVDRQRARELEATIDATGGEFIKRRRRRKRSPVVETIASRAEGIKDGGPKEAWPRLFSSTSVNRPAAPSTYYSAHRSAARMTTNDDSIRSQ